MLEDPNSQNDEETREGNIEHEHNLLADALGLKVGLTDRGGRGELTLSYASLEQLDDLCRRLMKA